MERDRRGRRKERNMGRRVVEGGGGREEEGIF